MRIAYLTGRYPATSHTFVAREVAALRDRGVDVQTFSIWAANRHDLPSEEDREEARRTRAILPLHAGRAIRAHGHALRSAPRSYVRAIVRAIRLGRSGLRGRALGCSWFVEAIVLWHELQGLGIRHVHVHLNGTAPSVALILTDFANAADDGRGWSWSMTVHGPTEFYDIQGERLAEKVRSARAVICISDFARSQLMAHVDEGEWSKLRVIHCGVDPEHFTPKRSLHRDGLELLSAARLTQAKGHAMLLRALEELERRGVELHLTIVGEGPKRPYLEQLARQLGVAPRITFEGAVGRERILEYYRRADAFCLPSFAEGVPIVLMEAMATELPVVATDIMGVRELVDDGVNGILVRPSRPDLLADAIDRLASNADLRGRLGAAGRETVQREFDIGRSAEQIHAIFDQVLASTPA